MCRPKPLLSRILISGCSISLVFVILAFPWFLKFSAYLQYCEQLRIINTQCTENTGTDFSITSLLLCFFFPVSVKDAVRSKWRRAVRKERTKVLLRHLSQDGVSFFLIHLYLLFYFNKNVHTSIPFASCRKGQHWSTLATFLFYNWR